jgi:hypothetical protein
MQIQGFGVASATAEIVAITPMAVARWIRAGHREEGQRLLRLGVINATVLSVR